MVQPGLDHSRRVSLPDNHSRRQLEDSCLLARCTWSVYQLYFYLRLSEQPLHLKGNLRALLSAGGGSSWAWPPSRPARSPPLRPWISTLTTISISMSILISRAILISVAISTLTAMSTTTYSTILISTWTSTNAILLFDPCAWQLQYQHQQQNQH